MQSSTLALSVIALILFFLSGLGKEEGSNLLFTAAAGDILENGKKRINQKKTTNRGITVKK